MLAILLGAVAMFAVGAVWFTVLFGKTWSRLMNFTPEQNQKAMEGGMASKMVVMFVLNLISASVLRYLAPQLLALSYTEFLMPVFVIWLGFTLPSLINTYLWEGKSMQLVLINAGGSLAAFIAGSAAVFFIK